MSASLLSLELRRTRLQLAVYAILVIVYGLTVAAIYPTVKDTAELFQPYLDMVPPGILDAFEMAGGIASPGAYFGSQFFQVWVLVAAMFAIGLGTRSAAAENAAGTIEIALSAPLSRTRYLVTAIAVQALGIALLSAVAVVSVIVVGPFIDVGFDVGRFAAVGVLSFAFACAVAGVSTLVSVVTLDRGRAIGFGAVVLILMYLIILVASLEASLEWLKYLSAFHYYRPGSVIDDGTMPIAETALFLIVAIAGWGLAVWRFRTRDLVS